MERVPPQPNRPRQEPLGQLGVLAGELFQVLCHEREQLAQLGALAGFRAELLLGRAVAGVLANCGRRRRVAGGLDGARC